MMTHILACGSQYFWCSDEHANGWAILLGIGTVAGIVVVFLAWVAVAAMLPARPPRPPGPPQRAPHDGRRYTFPVRAVTPGRTLVAMRCCRYGHRTADEARAHAERVKRRVEVTGR
jgi:hypothetical protein